MKKSSFVLFGMLAVLLTFGMVLAGCAGSDNPAVYPSAVTLAAGSQGTADNEKITGLTTTAKYIVFDGSNWYASKGNGDLGDAKTSAELALADTPAAVGASGTINTGSGSNVKTFDVYLIKTVTRGTDMTVASISNNTIVLTDGTLQNNDTYTFSATSTANTVVFVLDGNRTGGDLISGSTIAAGTIITSGFTYTVSAVTDGGAKIEYEANKSYVLFKNIVSTTTFKLKATT